MKQSPVIKMNFKCNQDWDTMKVTACGRYCDVCKKEVIDFTSKTPQEYKALLAGKTRLCGRFKPEQVDLSLIRPISISVHRKVFLFISTVFISLVSKPAGAASIIHPTEQIYSGENFTARHGVLNPAIEQNNELQTVQPDPSKPFIKTKKRKFYWSRRFPFIRSERVRDYRIIGDISF